MARLSRQLCKNAALAAVVINVMAAIANDIGMLMLTDIPKHALKWSLKTVSALLRPRHPASVAPQEIDEVAIRRVKRKPRATSCGRRAIIINY